MRRTGWGGAGSADADAEDEPGSAQLVAVAVGASRAALVPSALVVLALLNVFGQRMVTARASVPGGDTLGDRTASGRAAG